MMRKIRITSQIIILALFVGVVFFVNNQAYGYTWDSEFFLRFNPFTALLTLVASHSILVPMAIVATLVVVVTVLFGRLFCGFFCPLGTLIDAVDSWFFRRKHFKDRVVPKFVQRFKYVFMLALVVLSAFGGIFAVYFDPLSFVMRFFALIVHPVLTVIGNDASEVIGTVSPTASTLIYTKFPVSIRFFYGTTATVILALLVFGGGFWDKRFWCQYVCPSGAFLGLISGFSLFRRRVAAEKCSECKRCVVACPVHAIDKHDFRSTNIAECIACGVCVQLRNGCSAFRFGMPDAEITRGPDLQRRHIVAGAAGGLLLLPMFRANAVSKRDDTGRLIRPPGSIPERDFLAKCTGCGACMKACPTNTIQPCLFADGFSRLYTPKIVPRIAGCEEKCHLCGYVCPTGAIRKLPYEEKRFAKIGTAVIDRNKCVAWEQNKECLVCDEICPYNAISAYVVETTTGRFKVPVIDEELCTGCGMCEQHCPVFDNAAIVVFKYGENRRATGSYATDIQKRLIQEKRLVSDSKQLGSNGVAPTTDPYGLQQGSGGSTGFSSEGSTSAGFIEEAAPKADNALPPGFSD